MRIFNLENDEESKVKEIVKKANYTGKQNLEPTIDEFKKIRKVIFDYMIKNKRILYGGYALQLLNLMAGKDALYDDYDYPDSEFYSDNPIKDFKEICDLLYEIYGSKIVQGKEAEHPMTYKIFANGIQYSDISYVPTRIYNTLPYMTCRLREYDGLKIILPYVIMLDKLRMLTDPINSFRRLEKEIPRINMLEQNYPINFKYNEKNIDFPSKNKNIKKMFQYLIEQQDLVFIGDVVSWYYINQKIDGCRYTIGVVVDNYYDFLKQLKEELLEKLDYEIIQYHPFFQYWGKRCDIKIDKKLVLTVWHNDNKCYPYIMKNKIKIATFDQTLLFNMIFNMYLNVYDKKKLDYYSYLCDKMLESRETFLQTNKLSILDESPYKSLVVNCIGYTIDPKRANLLKNYKLFKEGKRMGVRYDPSVDLKFDITLYTYPNVSGNIVKETNRLQLAL